MLKTNPTKHQKKYVMLIETHEAEMPTSFEIQIIDRLSQVSDSDVEDAIQKSISK